MNDTLLSIQSFGSIFVEIFVGIVVVALVAMLCYLIKEIVCSSAVDSESAQSKKKDKHPEGKNRQVVRESSGTTAEPLELEYNPELPRDNKNETGKWEAQWAAQYEAVVGLKHRNANPPLPCQDAALSRVAPRPLLIVADGAGSAEVSEIGAQTVVRALARLIHTRDAELGELLDNKGGSEKQARKFALSLVKHAIGVQEDLAAEHRRPQDDFRSTLLMIIVGTAYIMWLKIGDGALVLESIQNGDNQDITLTTELRILGEAGKGEYANSTTFIGTGLMPADVQTGLISAENICGLAAMSDGAAERLVSGVKVAGRVRSLLHDLRNDALSRPDLGRMFYSDEFTGKGKGVFTGDDCALALLSHKV
ncbi:hypothetical protein FACS1894116_10510 [Betaproteobacteria bacterium]|nr:hypothetical protein FACS1894116_10510 [Betaproteobacteria bacterium]